MLRYVVSSRPSFLFKANKVYLSEVTYLTGEEHI